MQSDFHLSLCALTGARCSRARGFLVTDLFLPVLNFHPYSQLIKLHNPSAPPVSDSTLRLMAQRRGILAMSGRTALP